LTSGIVDEYVNLPVGGHCLLDDRGHVSGLGYVAEHPFNREPLRTHFRDGWREPLFPSSAQHQGRAGFRKPFGHLLAKAARPAGHNSHAAR
jgi:hypothetical protein